MQTDMVKKMCPNNSQIFPSGICLLEIAIATLRKILSDTHGECKIPDEVIRDIAKALLPNILTFFESEEGKREFDAWKKQQEQATKKVNTNAKKNGA